MRASDANSAIFLTDEKDEIEKKIQEVKFQGNDTVSRENLESDILYQSARFFVEDEIEWNGIKQDFDTGRLSAMELKKRLILILKKTVREIQEERENVTDEIVTKFIDIMAKNKADVVTPWKVEAISASGIDFDKLLQGEYYKDCEEIDDMLIERIENLTKKPVHHFLKRGIVISHSKMNDILDLYQTGKPFYLYTGRGPSSGSLHLGHLVPFKLTKWLQDTFDVPLVIQLADDEKFLCKEIQTTEEAINLSHQNAKDIIALGFDEKKTFIFSNLEYMCPAFYQNICRIEKLITNSDVMNKFGIGKNDSIGKTSFPAIQAAPSVSSSFPEIFGSSKDMTCLIPCALDQHIFFHITRKATQFMKCEKHALIHTTFLPALNGGKKKMSASCANSAIFLTDGEHEIEKKVEHEELGWMNWRVLPLKYILEMKVQGNDTVSSAMGPTCSERENIEADIPYQLAKFFVEDEVKWNEMKQEYETGSLSAMELKKKLISVLKKTVREIQEKRKNVNDDIVAKFMSPRPLSYRYRNGV